MTDVKSKNLYELLGNDHDQDSDKEPEPPTKAVDKPLPRSGKRDGQAVEKTDAAPRNNNNRDSDRRRGGFTGNERAFRDRTAGRTHNRETGAEGETGVVKGRDSGPGVQRGGRGPRGPRRGGDRHSRTGRGDHAKQVEGGWGRATGEGEEADEKAGQAIAEQEIKQDGFGANETAPVTDADAPAADAEPEEPENNNKSYADYLAELASKKMSDLGLKEARAPNEGAKDNKKWKSAKELAKDTEEENYFIGEAKARRERERAAKKEYVDLDYTFKEPPRESGRGGRGGRGRGEGRGGRGRGEGRGEYRGRGDRAERGDRPRGGRGARGGSDGPAVAVSDESAFPALGK